MTIEEREDSDFSVHSKKSSDTARDANEKSFRDQIEKATFKNFVELASCFMLVFSIYARFNILTSPYFMSETNLYLKKVFGKYFESEIQLSSPVATLEILRNMSKNLEFYSHTNQTTISSTLPSLKGNPNYLIVRDPTATAKFYNKRCAHTMPFQSMDDENLNETCVKVSESNTKCGVEESSVYKSINLRDMTGNNSYKAIFEYFTRIRCHDIVDEVIIDCDGFRIDLTDTKKINCFLDNFNMKSIKFEVNLFNKKLNQLINFKFVNVFFQSNGKANLSEINVIDLDRLLIIFENSARMYRFYPKLACMLTVLTLLTINCVILVRKLNANTFLEDVFDLIDLGLVLLLLCLIYAEIRINILLKTKLKLLFSPYEAATFMSLHELVYLFRVGFNMYPQIN